MSAIKTANITTNVPAFKETYITAVYSTFKTAIQSAHESANI